MKRKIITYKKLDRETCGDELEIYGFGLDLRNSPLCRDQIEGRNSK